MDEIMDLKWHSKQFDLLTPHELYAILRLRSEVFVVEQQCVFLDMDDKDAPCVHLMASTERGLMAYSRLVPPGVTYGEMSIGRVVTSPLARHLGLGRELMLRSIQECYSLHGKSNIRIGAQLYLKSFYGSLGFREISAVYDEDGIDHIQMMLYAD